MINKIKETAAFIKERISVTPKLGIVLGTGLGQIGKEIELTESFNYEDIPNFPVSTVKGHHGKLLIGNFKGKPVIALQGRFHYYEGYNMKEVTFPIRVMKALGVDSLILSNASGGLNPNFEVGDLMIITDHINLMPENPLRGKNEDELGPRFPDMSNVYTDSLIEKADEIIDKLGYKVQKGVYVGVQGPTFETPAEYKYMHIIGGDAVGMSTVPEAIVARHSGMKVFALSLITDLGVEGKIVEVSHEEVLKAAKKAEPLARKIIAELIPYL